MAQNGGEQQQQLGNEMVSSAVLTRGVFLKKIGTGASHSEESHRSLVLAFLMSICWGHAELGMTTQSPDFDDYKLGLVKATLSPMGMTQPKIAPVAASEARPLGPGNRWMRSVSDLENRVWLAMRVSGACARCWTEKGFSRVRSSSIISFEDGTLCTTSLAWVAVSRSGSRNRLGERLLQRSGSKNARRLRGLRKGESFDNTEELRGRNQNTYIIYFKHKCILNANSL